MLKNESSSSTYCRSRIAPWRHNSGASPRTPNVFWFWIGGVTWVDWTTFLSQSLTRRSVSDVPSLLSTTLGMLTFLRQEITKDCWLSDKLKNSFSLFTQHYTKRYAMPRSLSQARQQEQDRSHQIVGSFMDLLLAHGDHYHQSCVFLRWSVFQMIWKKMKYWTKKSSEQNMTGHRLEAKLNAITRIGFKFVTNGSDTTRTQYLLAPPIQAFSNCLH